MRAVMFFTVLVTFFISDEIEANHAVVGITANNIIFGYKNILKHWEIHEIFWMFFYFHIAFLFKRKLAVSKDKIIAAAALYGRIL